MGACTSANTKQKGRSPLQELPTDINSFDPHSTDKISFEGSLANVKIQNINNSSPKKLGIKFCIPEVVDIICPTTNTFLQEKIKWNINTSFSFAHNAFELRAKSLNVNITDQDNNLISTIKINLFKIIVGPYHHDFRITKGNKNFGRLIFDLKLTQRIELSIESIMTEVCFLQEYPGEQFFYQLESNNSGSQKGKTNRKVYLSSVQKIPISKKDEFRVLTKQDQAPSPTTRIKKRGKALIKVESNSKIRWQNKKQKKQAYFNLNLKVSEISSSSLIFKLYRFSDYQKKSEFGICSVLFSEIFKEYLKMNQNNQQVSKTSRLTKKIYNNGKNVAEVKFHFVAQSQSILKQINSRSLTQDGIVNMHHFQSYQKDTNSSKSDSSDQTNIYIKKCVILQELINKYTNSSRPQNYREITTFLQQTHQYIQNTTKSSMVYYSGKDKSKKQQQKQKISIKMLTLLAEILLEDQGDDDLKDLCWKLIIAIIKRGEMMLRNMGMFQIGDEDQIINKQSKIFQERAIVGEKYCEILCTLLKLSLDTEVRLRGQKQHAEMFKAYCYFRVPIFRQKIINTLKDGSQSNHETHTQDMTDNDTGQNFFSDINWDKYFYQPLKDRPKMKEITENLQRHLLGHDWFDHFQQRKKVFFDFTRYLIAKIITIKEQHKLQGWNQFPGYELFIKSALAQLRQTDLDEQWSYSLILMCISLLENNNLIQQIIKILYTKTNLHNDKEIRTMIGTMTQIFYQLSNNNCFSSSSFPYSYFTKGIKLILENSSNHLSLRLILIFLFKFYTQFQNQYRKQLSLYLLGPLFWKLFYNWSHEVRDILYHLILLKILQDRQIMEYQEISDRIALCLKIIKNSGYLAEKHRNFSKNYSILQQMKQKIKKRNKNKHNRKFVSMSNQTFGPKDINFEDLSINNYDQAQKLQVKFYKMDKQQAKLDQTQNGLYLQFCCDIKDPHCHFDNSLPKLERSQSHSSICFRSASLCHLALNQSNLGFQSNELQLKQLSNKQIQAIRPYFIASVCRFREVIKLIEEYYIDHNQLPVMQQKLQVLGVKLDRKDILPQEFHFQFFD